MIKLHTRVTEYLARKRFYSLKTSASTDSKAKSYQHTIFLPKTDFENYLKQKNIAERDKKIYEKAQFSNFYSWQRENLRGKEYVLHDGPPYANGKPHMGHAINKIMKDIILRSQVVQGNRVHYIPGWDCHGLPIEMTALKNAKGVLSSQEIRQKAREVASEMSKVQMKGFKQWGVMGDWDNQCYYTFDASYVANELQIFWKLFERGIIYYDLKPVFWSPSSKTALAESELLYIENHNSTAVTARFEVIQNKFPETVYFLVWTTTPWTLPLNKTVICSPDLKYSIVKISSFPGLYVIASEQIEKFQKSLNAEVTEHSVISNEDLVKFQYKHPWNPEKTMNVYSSTNVKLLGTGLLHSVPGHGHEDYLMGLENNLEVECFVDEAGHYTADAGDGLLGLDVLNEGSKYVIERLSSELLLKENYVHKYPYDWRTNKPVIIRASKQWFIDCEKLKERAVESLNEVEVPVEYFVSQLKNRPYWCLSRQRKWGIPIPAFFHKTSGRPLLSKDVIDYLTELYLTRGPDVWWTEDLQTLFPDKIREGFFVRAEDVQKGEDIMDIWFDSGISWSYVLKGKKSELYLEGKDQYEGWFQSSLLTSVAVSNEAPYKKIKTHGFAVDANGRKMSKSLGNVIDPETILEGFGVDCLRWWVASHGHHPLVPVSSEILKKDAEAVAKIRSSLRFLLGALHEVSLESLTQEKLCCIDRYLLNSCYKLYQSMMHSYNSYNIHKCCAQILFFVSNEVSARYVTAIKDRLYCDGRDSTRRRACQYTINGILDTLCHVLAPILPHLVEEVFLNRPGEKEKFFYKEKWTPPETWNDDSVSSAMKLLDSIKQEVFKHKDLPKMICEIQVDEEEFNLLKNFQDVERSTDSELTALLQVAEVQLRLGERKVTVSPTSSTYCIRCRRYTASEDKLCNRCEILVSNFVYLSFVPCDRSNNRCWIIPTC